MSKPAQPTREERPAREEPKFNFERAVGHGRQGLRKALAVLRAAKRGRPRKGETPAPTRARSIRLPEQAWAEIAREARRLGVTDATLVRAAIAHWLESNPK
jgi:hypothetical protein